MPHLQMPPCTDAPSPPLKMPQCSPLQMAPTPTNATPSPIHVPSPTGPPPCPYRCCPLQIPPPTDAVPLLPKDTAPSPLQVPTPSYRCHTIPATSAAPPLQTMRPLPYRCHLLTLQIPHPSRLNMTPPPPHRCHPFPHRCRFPPPSELFPNFWKSTNTYGNILVQNFQAKLESSEAMGTMPKVMPHVYRMSRIFLHSALRWDIFSPEFRENY